MPVIAKTNNENRKVIHADLKTEVCTGKNALTVARAKELLGWKEHEAETPNHVPELFDLTQKYVTMEHNTNNRYLTSSWVLTLRQEHLRKKWRLNGETIVIGKYGNVLSGQHRLIGLIIAEIERLADPDKYTDWWTDEITMDTILVFGVDESDDMFKTLNCGKPGTLAEVLFRSEHLAKFKPSQRKAAARIADYAVRLMWHRTGAGVDAYALRRTHAESIDFIERHPSLIKCVKHIYEEDQEKSIGRFITPGTAAGLMYLMASSQSDKEAYLADRREKVLKIDPKLMSKAIEFWTLVSGSGDEFKEFRKAMGRLNDYEVCMGGTQAEKIGTVVKTWNEFVEGNGLRPKNLELLYAHEDDGSKKLMELPLVGGIDIGDPKDADLDDDSITEEDIREGASKSKPIDPVQQLKDILTKHPNKVIMFRTTKGDKYRVWGEQVEKVGKVLTIKPDYNKDMDLAMLEIQTDDLMNSVDMLHIAKMKVATAERNEDDTITVTDVQQTTKAKAVVAKKTAEAAAPKQPKTKKVLRGGTNSN